MTAHPATEIVDRQKMLILLLVGVIFIFSLTAVLNRIELVRMRSDLWARWYATRQWLDTGRSLYDEQNGVEAAALVPVPPSPLEAGYYYPAYFLIITLPLAIIPFQAAHFVWTATGLFLLFSAIAIAHRTFGWPSDANQLTVFVILSAISLPVFQHAIWSQFDTIAPFCLAVSFALVKKKQPFWAGVALAGLALKPQDALPLLIILPVAAWFHRSARPLIAGLATALLALLASAFLLQPDWISGFLTALQAYAPLGDIARPGYSFLGGTLGPAAALLLFALAIRVFWPHRTVDLLSPEFRLIVCIALGIWWWSFESIVMIHLVAIPVVLILFFSALQELTPEYVRPLSWLVAGWYALGWAVFVLALTLLPPGWQINLAEFVHKSVFPLALTIISIHILSLKKTANHV